ncbi:MAG: GatB/YqeY domain-containing protein [Dehalococcoidia bacterium]|nr:GatB/YqeY domain-containing protein [Dehalococcoidia bacterium]
MTMKTRLEDDLKQAMRSRDAARRDVIRYLRSEIRNQEIKVQEDLDDDGVVQVLSRQAQQRRDSIEAFTEANRSDLVEKEQAELEIIMEYMPQQMTSDEITSLVQEVVAEVGASGPGDMGKVMSQIMPQVRGRAEGREVSSIVMEILRGL